MTEHGYHVETGIRADDVAYRPFFEVGYAYFSPDFSPVGRESVHTARVVPVYHLAAGVSQKRLRELLNSAGLYRTSVASFIGKRILGASAGLSA